VRHVSACSEVTSGDAQDEPKHLRDAGLERVEVLGLRGGITACALWASVGRVIIHALQS
jgi:hypothetical protein